MSLGSFFGRQFVDVVDWVDEPAVLAMRYPFAGREIQIDARLTMRELHRLLLKAGAISQEEFDAGKTSLLAKIG